MQDQFSKTELLLGKDALDRLKNARLAVFGLGGVGGNVVEALARSGVGALDIVDNDKIVLSNLNRQVFATHSTLDMYKVDAAKARILDINPECKVITYNVFYSKESSSNFDFAKYDYVIDAIDTVSSKIALIEQAKKTNTPIISAMGAGNKVDPTLFTVSDISKTSVCPLARVMRKELKDRGIYSLKVVYSNEKPIPPKNVEQSLSTNRKQTVGSCAFVPSVAGLIMAGEVIKDIIK